MRKRCFITDPDGIGKDFIDEWYDRRKDYIIARTSGSTGDPKAIRLLKSDMEISALATCRYFGINGSSILACPLSPEYIAGKMMIVRAIVSGARLVVESPSNSPLRRWRYGRPDLTAIVPSQIDGMLENTGGKLGSVIVGGAPVTESQERTMVGSGIGFYATYGMTETCSHVALRKAGGTAFEALPGFRFTADQRGCLVIESETMSFGRLVTNDIVMLLDERHFQWKGRFDNVIISGGIKLFPEEIEREIAPFVTGHDFFVTSRPSERWGEELVMVVEAEDLDTDALDRAISLNIDHRHKPKAYILKKSLPRTETGKLLRRITK